jgi:hypothetical protein
MRPPSTSEPTFESTFDSAFEPTSRPTPAPTFEPTLEARPAPRRPRAAEPYVGPSLQPPHPSRCPRLRPHRHLPRPDSEQLLMRQSYSKCLQEDWVRE